LVLNLNIWERVEDVEAFSAIGKALGGNTTIEELSLISHRHADMTASILTALGAHRHLKTLTLDLEYQHAADMDGLVALLASTSTLQKLLLKNVTLDNGQPWSKNCLLAAVRCNGSLRCVSIGSRSKDWLPVYENKWTWTPLSSLYFPRNHALPFYLKNLRLFDPTTGRIVRAENLPLEKEKLAGVEMVPTLFAAAQQARRTAPRWMLLGLLQMDSEYLDPTRGVSPKRVALGSVEATAADLDHPHKQIRTE
jgi:hypothetical protein